MGELVEFKFTSNYKLDDNVEQIEFIAKGYKKIEDSKTILYFKNDNAYKFIIDNDFLEVYVDESYYKFNCKKKTEAIIRNGNYSYKASIVTDKLNVLKDKIEIDYTLDFVSFKGEYKIILELL